MNRFDAVIVVCSPPGRYYNIVFRCWWRWWALLVCASYYYGTSFMRLAGGHTVTDTYVQEQST